MNDRSVLPDKAEGPERADGMATANPSATKSNGKPTPFSIVARQFLSFPFKIGM